MLNKVKNFIKEYRLISPGDLVILGVSGGPDSMALLHIMDRFKSEMGFRLSVAHLNHGLRDEAEADEKFVKEYCQNRDIPFYFQRVNIKKLASQGKKSLEEAGRDYRYKYFRELIHDIGADRIATAHHQDDIAETVLLHLLRGSGIKGLRGIMPVKGRLIRPLLCVSKREIKTYLENMNVDYCLDKSNYDSTYLRNRVRHKLIPYLQEDFNPRIVESLNQLADIAREENEAMEEKTRLLWEKVVIRAEEELIVLNKHILHDLHPAYQRRLILKALGDLKGESGWNMQDVQNIRTLAKKEGSSKRLHLKKGIFVNIAYGELVFSCDPPGKVSFNYKVPIPGRITVPEIGETFVFKVLNKNQFEPEADDINLDYDKLDKDIFLRSRQAGDIFRPPGLNGRKKIKDFFIDIKLPMTERDRVPLLASGNEVYVVFGLRISQLAAAGPKTERFLIIKREKNDR